ncbi:arsenate reductase [Pleomorphomonas diazotrophica]|uniref:Arsenate reductase n=1 Tax=Pleomorphomonas diazotrophica TaxID=1166257 RepID=A0A1I4QBG5_9HYPH|nr:arsenate reductase [Pleomorphomonas diazotrophica]PKR90817.1 arsenate reductase [Pleomorphomonas diazotrophica]SFM37045.1 arsenate reductase [Pleomorphomonas diazotrophica]
MPVTIYGIKNCDTMKKAFAWLDQHGIAYSFHDYKKAGIATDKLSTWVARAGGWSHVANKSGLTFRGLPEDIKASLDDERAIALMAEKPSMIRRPIIEADGGKLIIGFSEESFTASFDPSNPEP